MRPRRRSGAPRWRGVFAAARAPSVPVSGKAASLGGHMKPPWRDAGPCQRLVLLQGCTRPGRRVLGPQFRRCTGEAAS